MASSYETVCLTDIATVTTGKTNRQDAVTDGAYPLFDRSQEVKRSNKFLFDASAVIVPGEGKEFIPRYYEGKFDLHQRAYAVMPNDRANSRFVYYAILDNKDHFANIAVGSTVKSLRLSSFETMEIPFPTIEKQDRIAEALGSLDNKIALNNRLNDYLAA